ncbi:hypothetical protein JCM8547_002697 [Rhodosporidiobolus lusitaniae]
MPPTQALSRALLLPLHLSVIVSLHACFAGCRALHLLAHLFPRASRRRTQPGPADDLARGRWQKVPKHLAVRLAPGGRGWRWWTSEGEDKAMKLRQVEQLVGWCRELGIATLTVYDETGALVHTADDVAKTLELLILPPETEDTEGFVTLRSWAEELSKPARTEGGTSEAVGGSSATLVEGDPPSLSPVSSSSPFSVNLTSRSFGRPQLARVAQRLATERSASEKPEALSSEAVSAVLDALPLSEPDLLFVFGGPYLRLQGFPPWQIRLSEMYHHSSPSWLPSPPLTYPIFRRALDVYGRAEMRLGR